MKAKDIASILEKMSPVNYALSWDNVGMHVGRADNEVNKILITLDADDDDVEYAKCSFGNKRYKPDFSEIKSRFFFKISAFSSIVQLREKTS